MRSLALSPVAAWLCLVSVLAAAAPAVEWEVTHAGDSGPGSLREALAGAAADPRNEHRIHFGTAEGHFAEPAVIVLDSPLPAIRGRVTIDGFIPGLLWKAYGVTLDGGGRFRILEVAETGDLHLTGITLRNGRARNGGAVLNRGRMVIQGVTLADNRARRDGGAVANAGGVLEFINSTATSNRAARRGGALAGKGGSLRVIHATLADNRARLGGGIHARGELVLANSILSGDGSQCMHRGAGRFGPNLIHGTSRCGEPLLDVDPRLGTAGYYNGPTPVLPIGSDSPVLNLGAPDLARDAGGQPLKWDQRGNGDPRDAGGFPDLGAFERQGPLPGELVVDTAVDTGLRGCTRIVRGNCPLRAALELAAAGRTPPVIRFDPAVFPRPAMLAVAVPPDTADASLELDGNHAGRLTLRVSAPVRWRGRNGIIIVVAEPLAAGEGAGP